MGSDGYTSQQALNKMAVEGIATTSKTVGSVTFTGSGLNDMTNGGVFTGIVDTNYVIVIDGTGAPDTFKWSDDGGATWNVETVSITGLDQTLSNGVTIRFEATTGHTLADKWEFTALAADVGVVGKPNVSILTHASLAAGADITSSVLDMRNLTEIALTIACTFNGAASNGITVEIFTSYDNVHWDTEAWADIGLEPALVAGAVQITNNIDGLPAFMKVKITNDDGAQAVTLIEATVTKVE